MTPEQQAAALALGRAVLATERARTRLDAVGDASHSLPWQLAFDTWRDAYRAEASARVALAATAGEEVGDGQA